MRKYKLLRFVTPQLLSLFKTFLFLLFLFVDDDVAAQTKSSNIHSFHFRIGANYRVTPFVTQSINYSQTNPGGIYFSKEYHFLQGFAFEYSVEKDLRKNWSLLFTNQFRLKKMNGTIDFNSPGFFKYSPERALVMDFSLDILKAIALKKSFVTVGMGLGIYGVGSNNKIYYVTRDPFGAPQAGQIKGKYVHPVASAVFAWKKNNLQANIRVNYGWRFPGIILKSYLQPQLGIQYRLFSFQTKV